MGPQGRAVVVEAPPFQGCVPPTASWAPWAIIPMTPCHEIRVAEQYTYIHKVFPHTKCELNLYALTACCGGSFASQPKMCFFRQPICACLLNFLLCALFLSRVDAQATQNHWVLEHIGDISSAALSTNGKSFLVSSSQGAVGAIDARSGNLTWRQLLPLRECVAMF